MRKIKVRGRYSSSFKKTMCIAFNVGTLIFYTPHAKTEPLLATIEVQANTNAVTLGFDQISTTGSRTGVTNQELPASIETIDHKMMQERGTTQISDAGW